jgi:hypothetical protein
LTRWILSSLIGDGEDVDESSRPSFVVDEGVPCCGMRRLDTAERQKDSSSEDIKSEVRWMNSELYDCLAAGSQALIYFHTPWSSLLEFLAVGPKDHCSGPCFDGWSSGTKSTKPWSVLPVLALLGRMKIYDSLMTVCHYEKKIGGE